MRQRSTKAKSRCVKVQRWGPKSDLVHRYVYMFVCLCVYIKQPLTAIGGGGGPIGVFALAVVQHSTFLCDIQYCDLRKPTQQRSALALALFLPPTAALRSCHLLTFLFLSLSLPLAHLLHPVFFSICRHGKSSVNPQQQQFSQSSSARGLLMRQLSHSSKY